jgi:hypothetical protein
MVLNVDKFKSTASELKHISGFLRGSLVLILLIDANISIRVI